MAKKEESKEIENEEELLDDEIIELVDDEGKTEQFYHIATLDYKDEWYVFFSPVEETEEISGDEVVIFKLGTDEEGSDVFLPIEDEKVLNAVYEEYVKMMEEEGCGCDDECDCGCNDKEKESKVKKEEKAGDCGCGCGCQDKKGATKETKKK